MSEFDDCTKTKRGVIGRKNMGKPCRQNMQLPDSSIMYIVTGRESSIKYMRPVVYF